MTVLVRVNIYVDTDDEMTAEQLVSDMLDNSQNDLATWEYDYTAQYDTDFNEFL